MDSRRSLVTAAVASIATVLALGLLSPGLFGRIALAEWGQALAEGAGAVACALAAAHTRGHGRRVWALFAAGQAIWALTDIAAAVTVLAGAPITEPSVLDVGWLAFYVPMLAAVLILYRRLRPERGWQGLIDGLVVTLAVAAVAWTTVLGPLAGRASGGVVGTVVAMVYPGLDMVCLAALGWVILRHGPRTPPWLRWVVGAFALQSAAGLAYVASSLHGRGASLIATAMFMAAGWSWVAAGLSRRRASERTWAAGAHDAPPVWSGIVPFVLGSGIVVLGAIRPEPELRMAAGLAAVLMGIRAIEAMGVSRTLLAERDRLLVTDPLTGTFNRRFLADEAHRAVAFAERGHEALSVLALDLDRFKAVNDRFGHGAGDELLKSVATAIRSRLRTSDLLCRLGGDEFLILCPGTDSAGARAAAERIRVHVRECAAHLAPEVQVTASLGTATYPGDAADAPGLMRAADEALYRAKAEGRDLTAAYAEDEGELVAG